MRAQIPEVSSALVQEWSTAVGRALGEGQGFTARILKEKPTVLGCSQEITISFGKTRRGACVEHYLVFTPRTSGYAARLQYSVKDSRNRLLHWAHLSLEFALGTTGAQCLRELQAAVHSATSQVNAAAIASQVHEAFSS